MVWDMKMVRNKRRKDEVKKRKSKSKSKVKPSDKFLHKVSEAFEVSQEWLVTGVGDRKAHRVDKVDERLISWLNEHPKIIRELRMRSGLD